MPINSIKNGLLDQHGRLVLIGQYSLLGQSIDRTRTVLEKTVLFIKPGLVLLFGRQGEVTKQPKSHYLRAFPVVPYALPSFCTKKFSCASSSHRTRRTLITNLADKGVSVRVLQSIARHANISTTQCYIDVNDAMKRKAIELV